MDWGLLQPNSKEFMLRDDLVFYRWTYYVAAPVNITLRYAWALNSAGLGVKGEVLGFLTALLEAYRRIQWNFFRLENEVSFNQVLFFLIPFTNSFFKYIAYQ